MQKQAPTLGRLLVMVGFALSCFGLLLFLWLAFGGAVPLKPKGYRFTTSFGEATQLAVEADVRISGVPVGKVKTIEPNEAGRSEVVIEMGSKFAPIPRNTKAILRQKTLLGETFVELTPGDPRRGMLPEDGELPASQVSPTTELDEIFRAFDPKTRESFREWMENQSIALDGRGKDLSDAIGNLAPFARDTEQLLTILRGQDTELRGVVRDTGAVFDALSTRTQDLRGLIEGSSRTFDATARQAQALQDTFRVLPTFSDESRRTVERLDRFGRSANPLVQNQLRPAVRELSPTLRQLELLAPDLKAFLRDLDPLIKASEKGLPATRRFLDQLRPFLGELDPPLRNLNPMIEYLDRYKRELGAFVGNATAATQATDRTSNGGFRHYLRVSNPLNPEGLAVYPRRIGTNRTNAYFLPGAFDRLEQGLQVFDRRGCDNGTPKLFDPATATPEELALVSPQLRESVKTYGLAGQERPSSARNAPPCSQQPQFRTNNGTSQFPQLARAGSGRTLSTEPPAGTARAASKRK